MYKFIEKSFGLDDFRVSDDIYVKGLDKSMPDRPEHRIRRSENRILTTLLQTIHTNYCLDIKIDYFTKQLNE